MIDLNKKSVSYLKKKADKVFSIYVRNRDRNICITCGSTDRPQAGHYIPRQHLNTRYDEWNVNCQCYVCNCIKKGNMDEYVIALMDKYGDGIIRELKKLKKIPRQMKKADYIHIIKTYENTN
jgi:5-methylcytosine-specific restriction endonuclease McrA